MKNTNNLIPQHRRWKHNVFSVAILTLFLLMSTSATATTCRASLSFKNNEPNEIKVTKIHIVGPTSWGFKNFSNIKILSGNTDSTGPIKLKHLSHGDRGEFKVYYRKKSSGKWYRCMTDYEVKTCGVTISFDINMHPTRPCLR